MPAERISTRLGTFPQIAGSHGILFLEWDDINAT